MTDKQLVQSYYPNAMSHLLFTKYYIISDLKALNGNPEVLSGDHLSNPHQYEHKAWSDARNIIIDRLILSESKKSIQDNPTYKTFTSEIKRVFNPESTFKSILVNNGVVTYNI